MKCFIRCSAGIVFLIANIFCMFSVDKYAQKKRFFDSLDTKLQYKYLNIIKERRRIYYEGFMFGILLSILAVGMAYKTNNKNLSNKVIICTTLSVTLLTNYLYYMLKPKSDWMILYLDNPDQRALWLDIYRTMKGRFHLGFLFGLVSVVMFSNASCYIK